MPGEIMVVLLAAIGCGTGVVITTIDKIFGGKDKKYKEELRLAQERLRERELQIVELRRQNEQLAKQVEWTNRLVEAQDRVVKQLEAGDRTPVGSLGSS